MAKVDLSKLSTTDWLVVGGGLIALIALFLPWYGWSVVGYGSDSTSGFGTSYGWLGALLMVGAGVYLLLQRAGSDLSKVKLHPAFVVMGAAVLGLVIVIIRWISLPRASYAGGAITEGARAGIYIAILAGAVQTFGAVTLFRRSGEALPWKEEGATSSEA